MQKTLLRSPGRRIAVRRLLSTVAATGALAAVGANAGSAAASSFTAIGAASGADVAGDVQAGIGWSDFNVDGCPDMLVNTDSSENSRLLRGDCSAGGNTFTDVTSTHAPELADTRAERSALWGDLNNDGLPDLVRNGASSRDVTEIWLNRGPSASPSYALGTPAGEASVTVDPPSGGYNPEGAALVDYDGDGWLDIVFQNAGGIDIFENPGDGTADFSHVTPDAEPKGLPVTGTTGDYLAAADVEGDGDVDVLARLDSHPDLWLNDGGTFSQGSFDEDAPNVDKGAVVLCDLDSDGDLDAFWANGTPPNRVWRREADGSFTRTSVPESITDDVRGVACGDVDHDGDLDLLLGKAGTDELLLNTSDGDGLSFTSAPASGIAGAANNAGAVFADHDRDGDLDIAVNQNGPNELWRNEHDGDDYLMIRALRALPGGASRDDLGATVTLETCNGVSVGGLREVSGGQGMGTQTLASVHFGLPDGPEQAYVAQVRFVGGPVVRRAVVPAEIPGYQELAIESTDADDLRACDTTIPEVALTDPGDDLVGVVRLAADADDAGSGVTLVTFSWANAGSGDWQEIGVATAAPWAVDWDTNGLPAGRYDLRVVARDAAGNAATALRGDLRVGPAVSAPPAGGFAPSAPVSPRPGPQSAPSPGAAPAARTCALRSRRAAARSRPGRIVLSARQLLIDQRIAQAALRRATAIERWISAGIEGRDICPGALGDVHLAAGTVRWSGEATTGPAATPRPLPPGAQNRRTSGRVVLSARQIQVNQRIAAAAVRRANALTARFDGGLTGAELANGGVGTDRLAGVATPGAATVPTPSPRPPAERRPAARGPASFSVTRAQLVANQRISVAALRRLALIEDRIRTGLDGRNFRHGSITRTDLAPPLGPQFG